MPTGAVHGDKRLELRAAGANDRMPPSSEYSVRHDSAGLRRIRQCLI
jgi:hypothetical protein